MFVFHSHFFKENNGGSEKKPKETSDRGLPITRVKRIMRLDKDVKHVSQDATRLIAAATELFVGAVANGAYNVMLTKKRR